MAAVKRCGNSTCANQGRIGLGKVKRAFDWTALCWRTFCGATCKRAWQHREKAGRLRERAIHRLFHPP